MRRVLRTVEWAEKHGLTYQHTSYSLPTTLIKSQYGTVSIHKWLEKECMRIMRDPEQKRKVAIVANPNDGGRTIALFVNRVAGGRDT